MRLRARITNAVDSSPASDLAISVVTEVLVVEEDEAAGTRRLEEPNLSEIRRIPPFRLPNFTEETLLEGDAKEGNRMDGDRDKGCDWWRENGDAMET